MFARSRFQIGPSKQLQNNRCLALRRPPSCARQRCRFRRLLSRPSGSFAAPESALFLLDMVSLLQNIFSTNVPNELSNEIPGRETTEGLLAAITPENGEQENAGQRVVTSRNEWETIASTWPLKRLVAIWNSLPGVTPVEKFTSRQIALERIWRAVESPEHARREATTKAGKAKVSLPGRLESSTSLCPALPARRSDCARDPKCHGMAAADRGHLRIRPDARTQALSTSRCSVSE